MIEVIVVLLIVAAFMFWLPAKMFVDWWKEPRCTDGTRSHKYGAEIWEGPGKTIPGAGGVQYDKCVRCGYTTQPHYFNS